MKSALALLVLVFCASSIAGQATSAAQASQQPLTENALGEDMNPDTSTWTSAMPRGFAVLIGYKRVPVRQSFSHDTNSGDSFLPNANAPGSAGTTSLNRAQYVDAGFRYEAPANGNWSFNVDVTGLFAYTKGNGADASGWNLDDHENANDSRPAANAAFVYTDSNLGFDVALGISYGLSKVFYVGAVADLAGVVVDNGWDRFSKLQVQSKKLFLVPAGGLKLGLRFSKNIAIEGTALSGKNGVRFNGDIVLHL